MLPKFLLHNIPRPPVGSHCCSSWNWAWPVIIQTADFKLRTAQYIILYFIINKWAQNLLIVFTAKNFKDPVVNKLRHLEIITIWFMGVKLHI